jgi:hypothetical protein
MNGGGGGKISLSVRDRNFSTQIPAGATAIPEFKTMAEPAYRARAVVAIVWAIVIGGAISIGCAFAGFPVNLVLLAGSLGAAGAATFILFFG